MTAITPSTESLNFTHQFNFCFPQNKKKLPRNTVWEVLQQNPDFSSMKKLIEIAKLEYIYDSPQSNLTLFVPTDQHLKLPPGYIENMNILTARKLVQLMTLNRKIDLSLIQGSPVISLVTKLPTNKMYITTVDCQTIIHHNTRLLYGNIETENGIIHVVDKIPIPDRNTTASYYSQTY